MSAFAPLTRAAAEALEPLEEALADRRACERLLRRVGRNVTVSEETLERVRTLLPLQELLQALDADAELSEVLEATGEAVTAIRALGSLDPDALEGLPGSLATPEAWADLSAALPDLLLGSWLAGNVPALHTVLRLTGVCVVEYAGRTPRDRFRWDALGAALADPGQAVKDSVGWGGEFAAWPLQRELGLALARMGLPVRIRRRSRPVAEALAGDTVEVPLGLESDVVLFSGMTPGGDRAEVGLLFAGSNDDDGTLYVGNLAYGELAAPLRLSDTWTLQAGGNVAGSGSVGVRLRASGIEVVGGDGALGTSVALQGQPPSEPWILIGEAGGTRVELEGATIELGLAGTSSAPEAYMLAKVDDGAFRLVLDLGAADAFLSSTLGDGPTIEAGGELRWGSESGLSFAGGLGLTVTLPLELQAGPFYVASLTLELGASEEGARLAATAVAEVTIGPIVGAVDGIGAALTLTPAPGGEGLAGLAAELAFIPPNGLGIGVDVAGVVSGGGFLDIDHEAGRYAGVGELDILGVGLVAVGIVETKIPGAPGEWSMFLSLAARFTGIQLGFGFTLNGVGGLVGIDRGLDDEALGEAVRSGSLDAILFPENPIANAALILSEIDAVFPAARGQYVFGPIVKIGWGTPTLIEIDAGVVVQLPEPVTISLLGALHAVLPREETPVLELHVNFAGTLNVTEGTLKIDASLSGSQVAGFLITGDMAVRTAFLDDPGFLVSFGGFHPKFVPPDDFPELDPVGVSLDTGDALRVSVGGYFALTSNSVQFGARADLWAGTKGFSIEGGTSFDTLIYFEPFSFSIRLRLWVSVLAGNTELLGVLLVGKLSGPNPWKVAGAAEFRILGLEKRFEVDESFGELANEGPPETADPAQLVRNALALEDAWSAVPPPGADPVVVTDAGDGTALHPSGRVQVTQRLLPLDAKIECYGIAEIVGPDLVTLEAVGFAGDDVEDVTEYFASAQYFLLDEDEKLTAPSFTPMKAGLAIGGSGADAPPAREAIFDHEIAYRDPDGRDDQPGAATVVKSARDETMTRALGARTSSAPSVRYGVAEPAWLVTAADTGRSTGAVPAAGLDFFAARTALTDRAAPATTLTPTYEAELIA